LTDPALGYSFVYHLEIGMLFATLAVLGPLVRVAPLTSKQPVSDAGALRLAEFPT
jgi:MFS transporter, BCD family, chlorophyll transporter